MALPPGRKPLSDRDMINLLRDMAKRFNQDNEDTKSNLQQTADRLEALSGFSVEHLDPDKRSWYYDGDGTKRRKDE